MLIRNLNTRSDKRKEEKKQDETLRLAIANDANISSARKNAQLGILTPLSEPQQFTASQLSEDLLTNESKARDKLLETFSLQEANRIIKILSPDQIKFLNIFWKDIKQETMKGDVKLIDSKLFKSILESYINRTLAQKGLGDRVDINEPDEMREIIPSQSLIRASLNVVAPINSAVREDLERILPSFPNEEVYKKLGQLSDADAEGYVSKLMKAYRNVADISEWTKIINTERGDNLVKKLKLLYQDFSVVQQSRVKKIFDEIMKEKETPEALADKGTREVIGEALSEADSIIDKVYQETLKNPKYQKSQFIIDVWGQKKSGKDQGEPLAQKGITTAYYKLTNNPKSKQASPTTNEEKIIWVENALSKQKELIEPIIIGVREGIEGFASVKKGEGFRVGKGIVKNTITIAEPLTRWSLFGKLKFNNRLLDEKQIFSVKYPCSTGIHPSFKKAVPVSDTFHELITHLADTQKIDKRIFKDLENDEKDLFETFIIKSGMGRKYNLMEKSKKETEDLEERYKVIKGSYLAGNNSNEVKDELKKLINHFINEGKIEKQQGLKAIQNII